MIIISYVRIICIITFYQTFSRSLTNIFYSLNVNNGQHKQISYKMWFTWKTQSACLPSGWVMLSRVMTCPLSYTLLSLKKKKNVQGKPTSFITIIYKLKLNNGFKSAKCIDKMTIQIRYPQLKKKNVFPSTTTSINSWQFPAIDCHYNQSTHCIQDIFHLRN